MLETLWEFQNSKSFLLGSLSFIPWTLDGGRKMYDAVNCLSKKKTEKNDKPKNICWKFFFFFNLIVSFPRPLLSLDTPARSRYALPKIWETYSERAPNFCPDNHKFPNCLLAMDFSAWIAKLSSPSKNETENPTAKDTFLVNMIFPQAHLKIKFLNQNKRSDLLFRFHCSRGIFRKRKGWRWRGAFNNSKLHHESCAKCSVLHHRYRKVSAKEKKVENSTENLSNIRIKKYDTGGAVFKKNWYRSEFLRYCTIRNRSYET